MAEERPLYVAREEDFSALIARYDEAKAGKPCFLRLQSPFGGGRRALSGEMFRAITARGDDAVLWRVTCLDQENGLQWLVRMYGSLIAALSTDVLKRGKIEMVLNAQLPAQPKRVQGWYQSFISAMKDSKTDAAKGAVQLKMPQDNPVIGLVEVIAAISRKMPIVLELQNPNVVYSVLLSQFLESLHFELSETGGQVLVLLHDEPPTDITNGLWPRPLVDLYDRRAEVFEIQTIAPWGVEETQRYLDSKELTGNAARIAEIADGRPGFIAELTDILAENGTIDSDLADVSFGSLVPLQPDESELEVPEEAPKEGERKHAGAEDVSKVIFFAALLGQAFPSGIVADMGGYDRESVDDLIDALDDLFEEVQFAEELGTWIYKFKRGTWREAVLQQNEDTDGHMLAQRVGLFMERFLVPRGYGFIVKTARVYAEHDAPQRAKAMGALALTNDAPDVWALGYDLLKYFDEVAWPDAMRRTVNTNFIDRIVASGPIQVAEKVYGDVQEWVTEQDDRELTAWLLFAGSRLDARRQDFYRARDRANDALKLFAALENKLRAADVHNHLAAIDLQDGKLEDALKQVDSAIEAGKIDGPDGKTLVPPNVFAHAEHIRGLVARRSGKLPDATEHFRRANEVAGNAGIGQLALDAGLSFGETLLVSGQTEKARDALRRVHQIAVGLRNPVRERSACELLAQAEGALKNYEAALPLAQRTLQLSQQLKFDQVLPIDLYNLGFFHFLTEKPKEALTYFEQAEERVGTLGNHPVVKELYYFKGLAHLRAGDLDKAKNSLRSGLRPAQAANDWPKMVSALDHLASIEQQQGNSDIAKKLLTDAIGFAKKANLKDQGSALKRKLQGIA